MNKTKTYLQCGYEETCVTKDCLNCPRKEKIMLTLTEAEKCCIEDFAMCDLEQFQKEKPKELLELMQDIMRRVMQRIFNEEGESGKK